MALELKNLTKQVGAEVHIHPVNLRFEPGSFNTLLGTTLAGKTTLMQLMAGLERPTSGSVWFNGADVTGEPVQRRNVAMVYQQFINYPNFTVYENIASPLRVARLARSEIDDRVGRMAELLKLTAMLERYPSELSGGQQQRTAIARALVKDADLVLLDEPLANLDFKLREELRDELPKLFAGRNCVVVYATTEPVEALLLGGHAATLHEGRVTQFGPTGDLYRHPRDLITAQVFSDPPINTAKVEKHGDTFRLGAAAHWKAPEKVRGLADGEYTFGVRPHHVSPRKAGSEPVAVDGVVRIAELSGSESTIHFAMAGNNWVSQSPGIHPLPIGSTARLYVDVAKGFYFDADQRLIAA